MLPILYIIKNQNNAIDEKNKLYMASYLVHLPFTFPDEYSDFHSLIVGESSQEGI